MKKLLFMSFLALLMTNKVFSQEGNISFGVELGIPANDFQRIASDVTGIGLGGTFLYNPGDFPIYFGIEGGYMIYGKSTDSEEVVIDGNYHDADFVRNNNIVHGHLLARFKPLRDFPIMPYVDGMIGFKYLYTRTKLKVDYIDEALETNTEFFDWAWSYGGTIGVNINLSDVVSLNINVMYQKGGKAEYLTKDDIEVDPNGGDLITKVNKSATDMYIPHIGITFLLD